MARSVKRSNKRGGAYGSKSPTQVYAEVKKGGARKSVKRSKKGRRQTLTRKQKRSQKRETFLSTLNQMGGFIRSGSTQFFNLFKE